MRRNVIVLIVSTLLFSFLFYQQTAGINYLLFSVALVVLLWVVDKNRLKDKRWGILAALSILTGFFVAWHGSAMAVIANVTALSVLAVHSLFPRTSFFPALVSALFSYISSFVYMITDSKERKQSLEKQDHAQKSGTDPIAKIVIAIVCIVVFLLFLFMYRGANPVFREFTDKINLDFISFQWIFFTFFGYLLMYGFFYIRHHTKVYQKDAFSPNALSQNLKSQTTTVLGFSMNVATECTIIAIFLGLLNLLLLSLNIIDISFMASGGNLPTDITYADYVHRGVGTLIFSVILVIGIVMYFFRGAVNFAEKSTLVRALAIIWLAQNLIMLTTTAFRNAAYIQEYMLTTKRIGVYVWLLLTVFGLLTTLYKIYARRSTWYLIRMNGWAFYTALILLSSVNWDIVIARYNTRNLYNVDYDYLSSLNNNALPAVYEALQNTDSNRLLYSGDRGVVALTRFEVMKLEIPNRVEQFNTRFRSNSWKSWNYDDWVTYNSLP